MVALVVSLSAPEYGGRCSGDGPAEPMFFLLLPLSAPEYGGALFRRRARRAEESYLHGVSFRAVVGSPYSHGGVILVGISASSLCRVALFARQARRADEFLLLLAAAPEYSGVLTATVFLSSSEEMLDSGLPLVDADD